MKICTDLSKQILFDFEQSTHKKFKIRVTSKSTGRAIEINFKFNKKVREIDDPCDPEIAEIQTDRIAPRAIDDRQDIQPAAGNVGPVDAQREANERAVRGEGGNRREPRTEEEEAELQRRLALARERYGFD